MKTNNKLLAALLVFAMLTCTFFVSVPTFAEDATELAEGELAIDKANVAYNEMNQLAFTLKGTPAEGKEAGIAVWKSTVTGEKTLENASFINFEYGVLEGVTYWLTQGIAANEMSVKLTVAPCVRDIENPANVAIAGDFFEYSIYDYVKDRLSDDNVTDVQMKLYYNLVKYGNQAEKVVNGSINIPYVAANNGEINNTGKSLALPAAGDTLTLRANTLNADGDYFLYWTAPDGTKIYDRVTSVTASAANAAYTANYGAKADSAYAGAVTFDGIAAGRIEFTPSTSSAPLVKNGHYYYWQEKYCFDNLIRSIVTFEVTSDTDYTVKSYTDIQIKENATGKYLAYDKTYAVDYMNVGAELQVFNTGDKNEEKLDFDMIVTETATNEPMSMYIYYTTGSATKNLRIYMRYDGSGNLYFSPENNFGNGVARYAGKIARGEKISITAEIASSTELKLCVNGKAVTADAAGTELGNFTIETVDLTKGYIASFKFETYSYAYSKFELHNINFVDKDKFN